MQKQPEKTRNKRNSPGWMIRLGLVAVLVCMLIYGVSGLVSYFRDLQREKTTAAELKEIYYGGEAETEAPGEETAAAAETAPEAETAPAAGGNGAGADGTDPENRSVERKIKGLSHLWRDSPNMDYSSRHLKRVDCR